MLRAFSSNPLKMLDLNKPVKDNQIRKKQHYSRRYSY